MKIFPNDNAIPEDTREQVLCRLGEAQINGDYMLQPLDDVVHVLSLMPFIVSSLRAYINGTATPVDKFIATNVLDTLDDIYKFKARSKSQQEARS